jgi:hypothetical protein
MNAICGTLITVSLFASVACGSAAENLDRGTTDPSAMPLAVSNTPEVTADVGTVHGSSVVVTPSDLLPIGSPEAKSQVRLAPILESDSRAALEVSHYEGPAGEETIDIGYYMFEAYTIPILYISTNLELEKTGQFGNPGPVSVWVDGAEHRAVGGRMRASKDHGALRLDFEDLAFQGIAGRVLRGNIVSTPIERCWRLIDRTPGVAVPQSELVSQDEGATHHEIDSAWSSEFCKGIQRLFP